MSMVVLGMIAETFIHPGGEVKGSAVDLPVAREAGTHYPFIPGSSLKGALKDKAKRNGAAQIMSDADVDALFGKQENAGELLISDARLLLLPVRSLTGAYKWVTCPLILERLHRDLKRAGETPAFTTPPTVNPKQALGAGNGTLMLEERCFTLAKITDSKIVPQIEKFICHATARGRVSERIVILHDDDFNWFVQYGLAVQARNKLDDNKTSENLWYEEALPPDTVMYAMVGDRGADKAKRVLELFVNPNPPPDPPRDCYLQVGGNETVGQGWFAVTQVQL